MTLESSRRDGADRPGPTRPPGRIAGIDYGSVRLGIAITDPDQTLASPLETYTRRGPRQDAEHMRRLVAEQGVVRFVVGLPVHLDGCESEKSREARALADWLREVTGLSVELFDERFTSVEADALLRQADLKGRRRRRRLDMLAAQVMLSAYLEARQAHGGRDDVGAQAAAEPLDDLPRMPVDHPNAAATPGSAPSAGPTPRGDEEGPPAE